jgi:uncharacterized SAM-binding protein YcdF (DUF218 family)
MFKKTRFWILLTLLLTLAAAWYFFVNAGKWLIKDDKPVHGDMVVMLMGGIGDRVLQVSDLYRDGAAGKIIMVEEYIEGFQLLMARGISVISNATQAANALNTLGVPRMNIQVLPGGARSTMEESMAIRNYLVGEKDVDTIIIVTSSYHTRRASMIFKTALKSMNRKVTILCSPNVYTNFNAASWWKKKEDIQVVITEYVKMVDFLLSDRRKLIKSKER